MDQNVTPVNQESFSYQLICSNRLIAAQRPQTPLSKLLFGETSIQDQDPPKSLVKKRRVTFKLEPDILEDQQDQRQQFKRHQQQQQHNQYQQQTNNDSNHAYYEETDAQESHYKNEMKNEALKTWKVGMNFCRASKKGGGDGGKYPTDGSLERILEYIQAVVIPYDIEFGVDNQVGHIGGAERFVKPALEYTLQKQMASRLTSRSSGATSTPAILGLNALQAEELNSRYTSLTERHKKANLRLAKQKAQMRDLRDRTEELEDRVEGLEDERRQLLRKLRKLQEKTGISKYQGHSSSQRSYEMDVGTDQEDIVIDNINLNEMSTSPQQEDGGIDEEDDMTEDVVLDEGVVIPLGSLTPYTPTPVDSIGQSESKPSQHSALLEDNHLFEDLSIKGISHSEVRSEDFQGQASKSLLQDPLSRRDALLSQVLLFQRYCEEQTPIGDSPRPALSESFPTSPSAHPLARNSSEVQHCDYSDYLSDIPSDSSSSSELLDPRTVKITTVRDSPLPNAAQSRKAKARRLLLERERELTRKADNKTDKHEDRDESISWSQPVQDTGMATPRISISENVLQGLSCRPSIQQIIEQTLQDTRISKHDMRRDILGDAHGIENQSLATPVHSAAMSPPVSKDPRIRHRQGVGVASTTGTDMSIGLFGSRTIQFDSQEWSVLEALDALELPEHSSTDLAKLISLQRNLSLGDGKQRQEEA
ncbi:hypothetical protein BGX27_001110 [Mortierella sp. AM989]|nr:hypothetical protein BGX27_001110 [Mortierella sp. AM989]